jgi:hypothetical protein
MQNWSQLFLQDGVPIFLFKSTEHMNDRNTLFKELNALGSLGFKGRQERETPALIDPPTLGFEFDINYGATAKEPPPAAPDYGQDGEKISTHDSAADGFRLKGDGNRIEIGTKPFSVSLSGRKEMLEVADKIKALTDEFESLCGKAPFHPATDNDQYKKAKNGNGKASGRPKCIRYSKLVAKVKCIFPIQGQNSYYRQQLCGVAGSPQATIAIPLAKIDALVRKIKASEALSKSNFPLSGSAAFRLGLRSDALYRAMTAVNNSRNYHLKNKSSLTGGKTISERNYTPALQGLLILMVSYLISSELKADARDYEPFAKAYLPLNVKNHFYLLLDDLSADEKQVFSELYFDGLKQFNIFKLANKNADLAFAKATKLFPAAAVDWAYYFKKAPTWFDFVSKTYTKTKLLREVSPTEANPKHKVGDETLFAPLSKTIPYVPGSKRVIVEMRRIGTRMVSAKEWKDLMLKIYKLTADLN